MSTAGWATQVRSAFVIATDTYRDPALRQLRGPGVEAEALARVLGSPAIGGFDVQIALNEPEAVLRRQLGRFFADRGRADLLLLYITGHGVKSESGDLYIAATDTEVGSLAATGLPARLINDLATASRSATVMIVLDCCYGGAFTRGVVARSAATADVGEYLGGPGRIIITASNSIEYAFEGGELAQDDIQPSVFTGAFVRGLESGAADLDQDGFITADELYEYVYDEVRSATQHQTPSKWTFDVSGAVVVARSGAAPPADAPVLASVIEAANSPLLSQRLYAITAIENMTRRRGVRPSRAMTQLLESLVEDDSRTVAEAARQLLADLPASATNAVVEPPEQPPVEEPEVPGPYTAEPIVANDYWTVGDQLDYQPYAAAIAEFIQHPDTTPPLTIGIKAPWGQGKTSLMRMIQDRLDPPGGGGTSGGERRQRVELTPESRLAILGGRRRGWPRRLIGRGRPSAGVTNGTILDRLDERSRHPADAGQDGPAGDGIRVQPADRSSWRPTVWFNPWMYESGEQIWAGLAHEIISQVTGRMQPRDREAFWLELNLRRVDADAVRRRVHRAMLERLVPVAVGLLAVVLLAAATLLARSVVPGLAGALDTAGRSILAAGALGGVAAVAIRIVTFLRSNAAGSFTTLLRQPDYGQAAQGFIRAQGSGAYADLVRDPGYESRLGFLHLVQTDMRRVLALVATSRRPVVVFVDDLDRCSPSAVAQVIEAINLFLAGQFPNCVFVIAMEPEMVAAHIEVAYQPLVDTLADDDYWGESGALGWRFLDKIVQLPISLPVLRSEQAGWFLGAALVGHREPWRPAASPDGRVDQERVERIERSIQESHPSIEDIADAAAKAEEELRGAPVGGDGFSAEAKVAMRREFKRRLRPDNPEVQAIVATVGRLLAKNPREIKRFVNVFRFYAFIRQEREAAGLPVPDSLAQIAKLAVVAVRWPHLRAALGRQVGATERDTVLSLLEAPVTELSDDADQQTRRQALHTVLHSGQVPDRLRDNLLASDELCELLTRSPTIGTTAAGYL